MAVQMKATLCEACGVEPAVMMVVEHTQMNMELGKSVEWSCCQSCYDHRTPHDDGDAAYFTVIPFGHHCIDYGNPLPCCQLAERARDRYDAIRKVAHDAGQPIYDREAAQAVEQEMGPQARMALRVAFNLG